MRKLIALIAALSFVTTTTASVTVENIVSGMNGHNARVVHLAGEQLKYYYPESILDYKINQAITELLSNPQSRDDEFDPYKRLLRGDEHYVADPLQGYDYFSNIYEKRKDSMQYGKEFMSKVITGAGALAGAAITVKSGGLLLPVGIAIATKSAEIASDRWHEETEQRFEDQGYNALAKYLQDKVGANSPELTNLDPVKMIELDRKYKLMDQLSNIEKSKLCESCSLEEQNLLQSAMINNLSGMLKETDGRVAVVEDRVDILNTSLKTVEGTLKEQGQQIVNLKREFDGLADIVQEKFDKFQQNQIEIRDDLNILSGKVHENTKKIDENSKSINQNKKDILFLKDFMYGQMSPRQKLLALRNGQYGANFSSEKKKLLKAQLKFNANVGDFLNGANQVMGIAQNLGIKIPKFASDSLKIGQVAFNAISKLMSPSPDFLGAALSISGLFTKRTDPAAARHKQVMQALGVINQKLDVVLENQVSMLKNQQAMMQNQVNILKTLDAISKQISESSQLLYDKIELTRWDIQVNRRTIKEELSEPLASCSYFLSTLNENMTSVDASPYEIRKNHFEANSEEYQNCSMVTVIMNRIRKEGDFSMLFNKALEDNSDDASQMPYIQKFHYKIFDNFLKIAGRENYKKAILLAMAPLGKSTDVHNTYVKISKQEEKDVNGFFNDRYWRYQNGFLDLENIIRNPLSYQATLEVNEIINQVFFYKDIIKYGRFPTFEDLVKSKGLGKSSFGFKILENLKLLIDMSIAQVNLLNGQMIIPYLYKSLIENKNINEIREILKLSPLIRINFLNYMVIKNIERKTGNPHIDTTTKDIFNDIYELDDMSRATLNMNRLMSHTTELGYNFVCKKEEEVNCFITFPEVKSENGEVKFEKEEYALLNLLPKQRNVVQVHPLVKELISARDLTVDNMIGYELEKEFNANVENSFDYRALLLKSARRPNVNPDSYKRVVKYYYELGVL